MNKQTDVDNDDVVVIEQRDKRTYLYIAIASVLGIALGALIGSSVTASKWQQTYHALESQYQTLVSDKKQLVVTVEEKVANVDVEVQQKLEQAIEEQKAQYEASIAQLESQVAELEKVNLSLEQQVGEQKSQLADVAGENAQLNRQADMQATMFERSRELFQQELRVKQELAALQKERDELEPKLASLKKACDTFLEGTSWEAKSDACDKQDAANSRLSQINQMIRVHQMDLEEMKAMAEQLGL